MSEDKVVPFRPKDEIDDPLTEILRAGAKRLDTDTPIIELTETAGTIHADLTIGANVTAATKLQANVGLSCNGMMLARNGFILTPSVAEELYQISERVTLRLFPNRQRSDST